MPKQDLKDTFANALLPMYKLLFISNHDMTLGDMMDVLFKKVACIKKLYAMRSNKPQTYDKKINTLETNKKFELNNVDSNNHKIQTYNKKTIERNNKPQRKFIELTGTIDNILNVLLKEELIKLPPIVEPKFPNGVPKHFQYEEF